jgi:UDP-MurNAc hydroxylase
MQFKILGHASMYIKTENYSIVIDPWLLGSCYWRSWWNFPSASYNASEMENVDAVVISHIHWDHWHGPTLKRLFKGKRIITPDEPGMRSRNDLRAIGFEDIECVPHGQTISVGDIEITLYQFGLFLNDAAIVVRAGNTTLLNANDAKIAGWSLKQITQKHKKIDFAFRSHSSANARINYKIENVTNYHADDRTHYFRSFKLFMDAVSPTYAIPFASNHCHLHDEALEYNNYISDPLELRKYCEIETSHNQEWQIKVMLPGSEWSEKSGFILQSEEAFTNKENYINNYRNKVKNTLQSYRIQENKVIINDKLMDKFVNFFNMKFSFNFKFKDFILTLTWPDKGHRTFVVSPNKLTWEEVEPSLKPRNGFGLIAMPAIVFRDAIYKNMFHHAGISKRCQFRAQSQIDLENIEKIFGFLEKVELGLYPINWIFLYRFVRAYLYRWRELFVYLRAFTILKRRKVPLYIVEEIILESTNAKIRR